ncbi:MAG: FHA domain-containing protein [Chloroflexi bacterium]|nr:FHA domain-containing protein [Chloroflexota bacterium]
MDPAEAPPAPLTCPTCSSPYQPGDKFCKSCGTRLPAESGQVTGPHLVLNANGEETIYPLDKPEVSIGRSPSNDIAISSDGYISSHHARVVIQNGEAFVEDAGSTNGTFIRVRRQTPLAEGDEIKVGQSILKYVP